MLYDLCAFFSWGVFFLAILPSIAADRFPLLRGSVPVGDRIPLHPWPNTHVFPFSSFPFTDLLTNLAIY
jgi:hypothetical protein